MNEWIINAATVAVVLAALLLLTVVARIYDKQDSLLEQIKTAKELKVAAESLIEKLSKREITVWIARDKNGELYLFFTKPYRLEDSSIWLESDDGAGNNIRLCDELWPKVKWEDKEPLEWRVQIEYKTVPDCLTKKIKL